MFQDIFHAVEQNQRIKDVPHSPKVRGERLYGGCIIEGGKTRGANTCISKFDNSSSSDNHNEHNSFFIFA